MNSINPKPAEDSGSGWFGAYSAAVNYSLAIVAGITLMTVGSKIEIPFWPVPQTMQTASLMMIALGLPPRQALAAIASWLAVGLAGLPVFAGTPQHGIGLAYVMGPTGGYLLGFLLAAGLVSVLARGRGPVLRFGIMMLGLAVIYALGLAWLARFVPAGKVIALGFSPFIVADIVKVALVVFGGEVLTRLKGKPEGKSTS